MSLRRRRSSSSASSTKATAGGELSEDVPSSSSGKRWKKTNREMNGYASLRRSSKLLPRSKTTSHDLGDFSYRRRRGYIPHSTTLISLSNSGGGRTNSNISSKVTSDWSYCRPPSKPSAASLASQNQSPSQAKNCTRPVQRSKSAECGGSIMNYEERQFSSNKSLLGQDDSCIVTDLSFSSCRPFTKNNPDLIDVGGEMATENQVPLPGSEPRFSLTATSRWCQQQNAIGVKVDEDPSEGKSSANHFVINDRKIYPNPVVRSSNTEKRLSTGISPQEKLSGKYLLMLERHIQSYIISRETKLNTEDPHSLVHDGDSLKPLLSLPLLSYGSSSPNTLSPCSSSNSATTSNSISRMHQLPQYTNKLSHSSSLNSFKAAKTVTIAAAAKDDLGLDVDVDTQAERLYFLLDFVNTQEKITQVASSMTNDLGSETGIFLVSLTRLIRLCHLS